MQALADTRPIGIGSMGAGASGMRGREPEQPQGSSAAANPRPQVLVAEGDIMATIRIPLGCRVAAQEWRGQDHFGPFGGDIQYSSEGDWDGVILWWWICRPGGWLGPRSNNRRQD